MYYNLEAEIARKNINGKDIAKTLNISESNFSLKRTGKYNFKINECTLIKKKYFPNLTIDYLFESLETKQREEE